MIKIIKTDGSAENEFFAELKKREESNDKAVVSSVSEIIENVKERGDEAIAEYTKKFDGTAPKSFLITKSELEKIVDGCDKKLYETMQKAAENIRAFHENQIQRSFVINKENGVIMGQSVRGLNRVGIYVPGGTAAYPSSVLMNAIPAKIAGVREIIMVTPPSKDGGINCDIAAAAQIAGVDRIYMMGGAQAVAALAFGTESVPKVDKIVGPGNIYVATAKKLLYGTVDIDMIAGPSEILIMADENANPSYIAADLMSQAEHDVLASSILLTDSEQLAKKVVTQLELQIKSLSRPEIIKTSLKDYGVIIVCRDTAEMIDYANELAPEHLEVCLSNPMEYIGRLNNAGSIFLGEYTPEPLGDYFAGPNHVLPTSGTARFFSPLSVDSFIKKTSFTYYTQSALMEESEDIMRFARAEGLTAHENSIKVRI